MSESKWGTWSLVIAGSLLILTGLRDLYAPQLLRISSKFSPLDAVFSMLCGVFFVASAIYRRWRR